MNPNDRQSIQKLEAQYDQFAPCLEQLAESMSTFDKHYAQYRELLAFYDSSDWVRLYEETNQFPDPQLKCGILSQDQLYNLISDHNELLENLEILVRKMKQTKKSFS